MFCMALQRVSNIERIIDTLALGLIVVVSGLFHGGALLKWLISFAIFMSILELAVSVTERNYQRRGIYRLEELKSGDKPLRPWPHRGVGAIWAEFIILLLASISVFFSPATGRELILIVGITVSIDAGGLFAGKLLKRFGMGHTVGVLKNLSPNKTYAGYFGEIIFGLCAGIVIVYIFGITKDLTTIIFISASPIAGMIGDLTASGAKRQLGIKHSNYFMSKQPVFGKLEWLAKSRDGFLDMFDSISSNLVLYTIVASILR